MKTDLKKRFITLFCICISFTALVAEEMPLALHAETFDMNSRSLQQDIDTAKQLGVPYLEVHPALKLGRGFNNSAVFGGDLSLDDKEKIQKALDKGGIKIVGYGVIPAKSDWAKIVELVKFFDIKTVLVEATDNPSDFDLPEKLAIANNFQIGIQNTKLETSDPQKLLKLLAGRGKNIGIAGDTGTWIGSGIRPVDAVKALQGRLVGLHLVDRPLTSRKRYPTVILGLGDGELAAALNELKTQGYKGHVTLKYVTSDKNALDEDVVECLTWFKAYQAGTLDRNGRLVIPPLLPAHARESTLSPKYGASWQDRAVVSSSLATTPTGKVLWYKKPATDWNSASPIGNGRIGGMIYGGVADERVQLNDITLWAGGPYDAVNPKAFESLAPTRALLFEGKDKEASSIARNMLGTTRGVESYQTLGELFIDCPGAEGASDYLRTLDISTAVASVTYKTNGVVYTREYFCSTPDNVMVVRFTANKPKALSLNVSLKRAIDAKTVSDPAYPGAVILDGQIDQAKRNDRLRFNAMANAVADGGSVTSANGVMSIKAADSVTLFISSGTDFPGLGRGGPDRTIDIKKRCADTIAKVSKVPYAAIKAKHVADYQKYFNTVSLDLGPEDPKLAALPTDERVINRKTGSTDTGLESLVFLYGRYLLISTSRPGSLPANLQGMWCWQTTPPWDSDYHTNINIQMNYWSANVTGLSEMEIPLIDLTESLIKPGQRTAQVMYQAKGWVVHHLTDLWGYTAVADGLQGIWPVGAAWLSRHPWEHYLFTGDENFLRQRGWPIIKGASEFILDFLIQGPPNSPFAGKWVTNPSHSPENQYLLADGSTSSLTVAATMDIQIVRDVLQNCIEASKILKCDVEHRKRCEDVLAKLYPVQIGSDGRILEWYKEFPEAEVQHRHVSHLFGLYPGYQITPSTPDFFNAAKKTLEVRGDGGPGWSKGWKVNFWSRLHNGDRAYKVFSYYMGGNAMPNLFNNHPPFQIDGGLGITAGVAEMLLQSHERTPDGGWLIEVLPALPSAWPQGSVKGLRTRGAISTNIDWKDGKLSHLILTAKKSGIYMVRYGNETRSIKLTADKPEKMNF